MKTHFILGKVVFAVEYIVLLIWFRKIDLAVIVRTATSGGSNEHPQRMFGAKKTKENTINNQLLGTSSRFMEYCIIL